MQDDRKDMYPFAEQDVDRLRSSISMTHTLASIGAKRLRSVLASEPYIAALGALTGGQAVQQAKAGLKAIYVSGWQTAADNNDNGQTYPDLSLYAPTSVPKLVRRINNAFRREDQIRRARGCRDDDGQDIYRPIIADAEAGFGGVLNVYELVLAMIEAGAAGIHLEDQISTHKRCGHLGGKVLLSTHDAIQNLIAARLACEVERVPLVIIARTDANAAQFVASDADERDHVFMDRTVPRTAEGFYTAKMGLDHAIARALSYAPYADMLWCETATPNLEEARVFATAIHKQFPKKWLAYNCSPSFNWQAHLTADEIAEFQEKLATFGYKFQFVTLAGFHALNHSMFSLAKDYKENGMKAYAGLQQCELGSQSNGYSAVKHQEEVGTGYFDLVLQTMKGGQASTQALVGSTETKQFH
jgi:isocitrate lyase